MKRPLTVLLVVSAIAGWLLWLAAASFLTRYLLEAANPVRHELGIGVAMAIVYGFWPALCSLIMAVCCRTWIPRWLVWASVMLLPAYAVLLATAMAFDA